MRFSATLDARVFERRNRRVLANHRRTRDGLVLDTGRRVHKNLDRDWPRDTNRSYRGWAMAHRDIGVRGVVVPALKESAYNERNLQRLQSQVAFYAKTVNRWAGYEAAYARANRTHQGYYRVILKEIRFHERRYRRAVEELFRLARAIEEGGTPVVIGSGRKKLRRGVPTHTRIATVRATVYGGEGRIRRSGDATVAEIRNKEPHTRIVERNRRLASKAVREATRGPRARRLSKKRAVEMLHRGTPWAERGAGLGAAA